MNLFYYFKKLSKKVLHFIRLYIKIGLQSGMKWCEVVDVI